MALLGDAWKARRMKEPVDGVAQVVGSIQPPDSARSSRERRPTRPATTASRTRSGSRSRDCGALTEDEFEREKARILGS
jgi:hypothetical protein